MLKRNALFLLELKASDSGLKIQSNNFKAPSKWIIDVYPQMNETLFNDVNNEEFKEKTTPKRNSSMILEEEDENNLINQHQEVSEDDEVSLTN